MNSPEILGRYLSADLGEADLMGIASKYPTLFWTALIAFIVALAGYAIYYFFKKKN